MRLKDEEKALTPDTPVDETDMTEYTPVPEITISRHSLRGSSNFTTIDHRQSQIQSVQQTVRQNETRQRVVLIGGPHKTGSSSIQKNFYKWTNHDQLPGWSWPIPDDFTSHCSITTKAFYPFIENLSQIGRKNPIHRPNSRRPLWDYYDSYEQVIESFQNKFLDEWKNGKHLVIGSEAMDRLNLSQHAYIYDNLLDTMPWNVAPGSVSGSDDDITFVIKYRVPRVSHLISIWHQCCMKEMNLLDFLKQVDMEFIYILDSLGYVSKILSRGLKVALVDLDGVVSSGYDISSVIACDVLNVPCTEKKRIVGDNKDISISNVKAGKGDMGGVTQKKLNEIEKKIRIFDCNFKRRMSHPKLTILYQSDMFNEIMEDCENIPEKQRISSQEHLIRVIQEIANGDMRIKDG